MSPQSRCTSFVLNRVRPPAKPAQTTNAPAAQYRGTLIGDSRLTQGLGALPVGAPAFSEITLAELPPLAARSVASPLPPRAPPGDLAPTAPPAPPSAPHLPPPR